MALESASAEEHARADELALRRGLPRPGKRLGHGAFGPAFETDSKDWVVKVTRDDGEARTFTALWLGLVTDELVVKHTAKVLHSEQVAGSHRWVIWKERVKPGLGGKAYPPISGRWSDAHGMNGGVRADGTAVFFDGQLQGGVSRDAVEKAYKARIAGLDLAEQERNRGEVIEAPEKPSRKRVRRVKAKGKGAPSPRANPKAVRGGKARPKRKAGVARKVLGDRRG